MHYFGAKVEVRPQSNMSGSGSRPPRYQLPFILLSGAYAVVAVIAGGYYHVSPHTALGETYSIGLCINTRTPALYFWNAVLPVALAPAYESTVIVLIGVFIAVSIVLGADPPSS